MDAATAINPRAVLKPQKPPRLYSLAEYLRMEARAEHKHEYQDGKIIKMPYARGPHNIISGNVTIAVGMATMSLPKNYIVFSSDQLVYFPALNHGAYADALVVCEKPLYWDDDNLLLINPILVVEVLSKSTRKYDRAGKFDKYKTLESFREYVLVEQDKPHVESWFREAPGLWRETVLTDLTDALFLKSIGISLPLAGVYRNIEFPAK